MDTQRNLCKNKERKIKETLIQNEMRHLTSPTRQSYELMEALLHDAFVEIGLSGKMYTKNDVLKAMPLPETCFVIKDYCYKQTKNRVFATYTLVRDQSSESRCRSEWIETKTGLKLIYFESHSRSKNETIDLSE